MFSYRHAFHAGNHADVLKHMVLHATLSHLRQKETGFTVIDTHAGAGLYRLDQGFAQTSGEAAQGILRLMQAASQTPPPAIVQAYLKAIENLNPNTGNAWRIYPGSPKWIHDALRPQDNLKLCEVHPTDAPLLIREVKRWAMAKAIEVKRQNGFEAMRAWLPTPTRRALIHIDPSYELASDYTDVTRAVHDALTRMSYAVIMVWYPEIARLRAHDLPKRLKTWANQAKRPWLHLRLNIGAEPPHETLPPKTHVGLRSSGVVIINPPYTLATQAQQALPYLAQVLGRGKGQMGSFEASI